MEDYFENPKKYNKVIWKYLDIENPDNNNIKDIMLVFEPEKDYGILRRTLYKIKTNPKEGSIIKIIICIKADETEVVIQDWYNVNDTEGRVNVVKLKAKTEIRAVYNACVDYIIKTS